MSELIETVDRVFADLAAARNGVGWSAADWASIEEISLGLLLVPEEAGGFGGSFSDLGLVMQRASHHAIALPIGETLLVQGVLARAGVMLPLRAAGPMRTASFGGESSGGLGTHASGFTGVVSDVPWGDTVDVVLIQVESEHGARLIAVDRTAATACHRTETLAGEPRARLEFKSAPLLADIPAAHTSLFALGALLRAAQIGGALSAVLEQSVQHASTRSQFGKTLSQFQVIQHQLALLAEEAAAVNCAALAACKAQDKGDAMFEIAAAKLRANRAVGAGTSIAHQIHGAIGFTAEHALHRWTQRLWNWRSEFGNDREWALHLGADIAERGAADLWASLTARGDR